MDHYRGHLCHSSWPVRSRTITIMDHLRQISHRSNAKITGYRQKLIKMLADQTQLINRPNNSHSNNLLTHCHLHKMWFLLQLIIWQVKTSKWSNWTSTINMWSRLMLKEHDLSQKITNSPCKKLWLFSAKHRAYPTSKVSMMWWHHFCGLRFKNMRHILTTQKDPELHLQRAKNSKKAIYKAA